MSHKCNFFQGWFSIKTENTRSVQVRVLYFVYRFDKKILCKCFNLLALVSPQCSVFHAATLYIQNTHCEKAVFKKLSRCKALVEVLHCINMANIIIWMRTLPFVRYSAEPLIRTLYLPSCQVPSSYRLLSLSRSVFRPNAPHILCDNTLFELNKFFG